MDLTSLANVKAYGNTLTTGDDTVINTIIPAMSAAVENNFCNQTFGVSSVNQVGTGSSYRAVIDEDGILTFYPPYNPINAVTALQYRQRGSLTWQNLVPANLDIQNQDCGPVLRLYGANFSYLRANQAKIQVQATFTAGFANLAALPADLEYAVRRLVWWAYKKRSASEDKTAIPEMGMLIIPSAWPADVVALLSPYKRYFSE